MKVMPRGLSRPDVTSVTVLAVASADAGANMLNEKMSSGNR
jgi:hypothetical protein